MTREKGLNAELILNSIDNGIVAIDGRGSITYFNKAAERMFKIPSQEAIDRHIMDVIPDTCGKLLECLGTERPFYGEKLKGENATLISNINPVIKNGKVLGVVSVFQDISGIERASKELGLFKDVKDWLDTIIDCCYDGLWISDHEGKVIRINKAAERIDGVVADEVLGRNVRELVAEGLFDKSVTLEVLKRKTLVTMIQQIKGTKRVLVTGSPILNEKGEISFVVINVRDISELDSLRNQLQETQALAKRYISKLSELEMKGVDLSNIIFRSEWMERILGVAVRVAKVNSTVLLLGESGVGKGMIAKLIHKHSDRNTGPFIRISCAGIPDALLESELFGYEKGAFTGAKIEGKPGFFELAHKGTLFLDEIGEIPLISQSKLLRFLEDHEIIRVGGTLPKEVDVRVIAATNRNIEEMVSAKSFRQDLYYRLNVVPIHIPALRERQDDIPPLSYYFLEKFNRVHQKEKTIAPEAIEAFCKYDFPGNIRELANIIERLVVTTEKKRIEVQDLPNAIGGHKVKEIPYFFLFEGISLRDALEKCESHVIERTIKKYGSQHKAAKILKVDQATISRKMKRYKISGAGVVLHTMMLICIALSLQFDLHILC